MDEVRAPCILRLQMSSVCAFLGHQPAVSLAELLASLPDLKNLTSWDKHVVTLETNHAVDARFLSLLGGTTLMAIATHTSRGALPTEIPRLILKWRQANADRGKITFSLRSIGVPRETVRALYRDCKAFLRRHGHASRYVGSERHPLAPGVLSHYGIPGRHGLEVVILQMEKNMWIGTTTAAQDIAAYSHRDAGKPARNLSAGLLPPKLAQVLLNLASWLVATRSPGGKHPPPLDERPALTIWDPFVGSGTIAIEALLRRWEVLASDTSRRALTACEKNIAWFRQSARTPKSVRSDVFRHDATESTPPPRPPHAIVTETSLGPPLKDPLPLRSIPKALREAEALERDFLSAVHETCPECPVVCTFPVYVDRTGEHHPLPGIVKAAQQIGYGFRLPKGATPWSEERPTLLYLRRDQWVGREIACLDPAA